MKEKQEFVKKKVVEIVNSHVDKLISSIPAEAWNSTQVSKSNIRDFFRQTVLECIADIVPLMLYL